MRILYRSNYLKSKSPKVAMTYFQYYILPHIDYGSQIYLPRHKKNLIVIEKMQKRFTKYFCRLYKWNYTSRLDKLNTVSIKFRLKKHDLIFLYKIINKMYNINNRRNYLLSSHRPTRQQMQKLIKKRFKTSRGENIFPTRIINDWNAIDHSKATNSKRQLTVNLQMKDSTHLHKPRILLRVSPKSLLNIATMLQL